MATAPGGRPTSFSDRARLRATAATAAKPHRRGADPCVNSRPYTDDEFAFLMAMDRYRHEANRPFPTWSEALEVLLSLGYRKVEPPGPLPIANHPMGTLK